MGQSWLLFLTYGRSQRLEGGDQQRIKSQETQLRFSSNNSNWLHKPTEVYHV